MKQRRTPSERLEAIYGSAAAPSRILPMEGVRGFAVLLVFCVHFNVLFRHWTIAGGPSARLWSFLGAIGHSGVDLFFVLSGFLIYAAVLNPKTRFGRFMRRRVERIYPPFVAVFIIYAALSVIFPAENKIPSSLGRGALFVVENLLLLPGIFNVTPIITVAWSLSYEMLYYLLIPIVMLGLGMRDWKPRSRVTSFVLLAAAYSGYCTLNIHPRLQLIMFVSGIVLCETLRAVGGERDSGSTWRRDCVGLLALLVCFAGFAPNAKVIVQFFLFPVFLYACFRSTSFLGALFSGRFIRYLGNMSYSYYLLHGLTLKFVALVMAHLLPGDGAHELAFWLLLPIGFVATWLTSTVLYVLVEKRFSLPARAPRAEPIIERRAA
jgi:exopolysaccharide production protein ExoZ